MRYWLHVALPLCAGAAVFLGQMSVGSAAGLATFTFVIGTLGKTLAIFGALIAALSFDRGDYLRRAWFLIVANYSFIAINVVLAGSAKPMLYGLNAVHLPGIAPGSVAAAYIRSIGVIIGNTLGVIGTLLLARAWAVAGLESARSALRWTVIAGAIGLALALLAKPAYSDINDLLRERSVGAAISVASDFGDFISFSLIAPMLLTALALRGGMLMWPWALYTGSQFSWMLFDAVMSLPTTRVTLSMGESARVTACMLSLSAGVAQHYAVRGPRREVARA